MVHMAASREGNSFPYANWTVAAIRIFPYTGLLLKHTPLATKSQQFLTMKFRKIAKNSAHFG